MKERPQQVFATRHVNSFLRLCLSSKLKHSLISVCRCGFSEKQGALNLVKAPAGAQQEPRHNTSQSTSQPRSIARPLPQGNIPMTSHPIVVSAMLIVYESMPLALRGMKLLPTPPKSEKATAGHTSFLSRLRPRICRVRCRVLICQCDVQWRGCLWHVRIVSVAA